MDTKKEYGIVDVLIVGAGPAGLCTAIKLKQYFNQAGIKKSIVVVDKAKEPGYHSLSGAVIEADWIFELFSELKAVRDAYESGGGYQGDKTDLFFQEFLESKVKVDETLFLATKQKSFSIPHKMLEKFSPHSLHRGDYLVSISKLIKWLVKKAKKVGVEVYTGFAFERLIIEEDAVCGAVIKATGVDKDGAAMENYSPEQEVRATITVLADGATGNLSTQLIGHFKLDEGKAPPVYAVGIKEVWEVPDIYQVPDDILDKISDVQGLEGLGLIAGKEFYGKTAFLKKLAKILSGPALLKNQKKIFKHSNQGARFGANRAVHTFGYPFSNPAKSIFSGGTIYSMGTNKIAISLIIGLDWKFKNVNPQECLQVYKEHAFLQDILKGGRPIAAGAKLVPEGGISSMPRLVAGKKGGLAVMVGDNASMVDLRKFKGIHCAAEAGISLAYALYINFWKENLTPSQIESDYMADLERSILPDLRESKNFRQVFAKGGLYFGIPLTLIQKYLPQLKMEEDHKVPLTKMLNLKCSGKSCKIDKPTMTSLSGSVNNGLSHIKIDTSCCKECIEKNRGAPFCVNVCPARVYEVVGDKLVVNHENCVLCRTCEKKGPYQKITIGIPEGGEGPKYKEM